MYVALRYRKIIYLSILLYSNFLERVCTSITMNSFILTCDWTDSYLTQWESGSISFIDDPWWRVRRVGGVTVIQVYGQTGVPGRDVATLTRLTPSDWTVDIWTERARARASSWTSQRSQTVIIMFYTDFYQRTAPYSDIKTSRFV